MTSTHHPPTHAPGVHRAEHREDQLDPDLLPGHVRPLPLLGSQPLLLDHEDARPSRPRPRVDDCRSEDLAQDAGTDWF